MSEDADTDDDLDPEMEAWFADFVVHLRASVAKSLLRGNDACCFTARQYADAYDRVWGPSKLLTFEQRWSFVSPEEHLRSIPHVVREVAPGVWAAADNT